MRRINLKKHKILLALLIIILAVAGYFVYEKVAYQMNKRAFAETKSAIDTVYADIVSKVGQPDDKKTINDCSAVREVYGNGPSSCSLSISFIYSVRSKSEAGNLRLQIQKVVSQNSKSLLSVSSPPTSNVVTPLINDNTPITDYFKSRGGVPCRINYIYDPIFNTELSLKSKNSQSLYIEFYCFGHSRGIYYSVL